MQDSGEARPRWSQRRSGVSELPDKEGLVPPRRLRGPLTARPRPRTALSGIGIVRDGELPGDR